MTPFKYRLSLDPPITPPSSCLALSYQPFHTSTPPSHAKLMDEVLCLALHCYKLPSVRSCPDSWRQGTPAYQKFEKNHSKICQFNGFWVKHTYSPLYRSKLTSREGRDATGTYVDLVWCQHERLAHLCREEEQTPLLPSTFANDERYQQHISPTSLSRYSLSRNLKLQP